MSEDVLYELMVDNRYFEILHFPILFCSFNLNKVQLGKVALPFATKGKIKFLKKF